MVLIAIVKKSTLRRFEIVPTGHREPSQMTHNTTNELGKQNFEMFGWWINQFTGIQVNIQNDPRMLFMKLKMCMIDLYMPL